PASVETCSAHLGIRRRQLLEHGVVDAFPIWTVADGVALIAPPYDIAAIDHELGPPGLYVVHDLARDPIAALELENVPMYSGKELHVLDRCTSDPTLVYRQGHHLAPRHEGHDDLAELLGGGVEDHFHVAFHNFFGDLLRHDQAKHLDE